MKVLVTGSSGYCGIAIVRVLLEHACRVVGFSLNGEDGAEANPNFSSIRGDLNNFAAIFSALEGVDAVIHSAVGSRVQRQNPEFSGDGPPHDFSLVTPFQINVGGTFNVFEAARQRNIRQVVNISSGAVIFHHIIDPLDNRIIKIKVDATTPPALREDYGLTKLLQEQVGWYYSYHYNFLAPTLRPWWVVDGATSMTRLDERLENDLHALGSAGWVDRGDLGKAAWLAIERQAGYGIFYLASAASSELFFDLKPTYQVLGWQPHYRFAKEIHRRQLKGMDCY